MVGSEDVFDDELIAPVLTYCIIVLYWLLVVVGFVGYIIRNKQQLLLAVALACLCGFYQCYMVVALLFFFYSAMHGWRYYYDFEGCFLRLPPTPTKYRLD